jgi:prophage regulatory protein
MQSTCLLRLPQLIDRTGIKKTELYELQKDGLFPMRVKITAHAVGWVEAEAETWITGRVAASGALPCQ